MRTSRLDCSIVGIWLFLTSPIGGWKKVMLGSLFMEVTHFSSVRRASSGMLR